MKYLIKTNKRGFTMIESLVAISILLIAVVGPLSLLAMALRDSVYIRNEITANYLAQEGLEIMTFFSDEIIAGSFCVDATKDSYDEVVEDSLDSCLISYNGTFYGKAGEPTIFYRVIEVEKLSDENTMADDYGGEEFKVTSTVSWRNAGFSVDRNTPYSTYIFQQ